MIVHTKATTPVAPVTLVAALLALAVTRLTLAASIIGHGTTTKEAVNSIEDKHNPLSQLERQIYLEPSAYGTPRASDRIMKELTEIYKSDSYKQKLIEVELVDDNLYEWEVKLRISDSKSPLHADLLHLWEFGEGDQIVLRVTYSDNYPNEPPFVRVIFPVIAYPGSHVMPGGALCMELLTSQGWNPDCTSEALLLSIAALLVDGGSRVHFNDSFGNVKDHYNAENAKQMFDITAEHHRKHGW